MNITLCLLGNGSQADEIESFLDKDTGVSLRAVSQQYLPKSNERVIDIADSEKYNNMPVIAAVGTPGVRRQMVEQWAGNKFHTLISERAITGHDLIIGDGSVIAPGAVITTNVIIGQHCLVNIGSTISHDSKLGNYVTVSPGAHIAGNTEIGDGVFIGIGAIISNKVKIASGSVIGAGTVVLNDVTEPNSVVVGIPGKMIRTNESWLNEL